MSVLANNLDVAGNATSHQIVYMAPSVCITPAAPSPIPMPYPIMTPTGTQETQDHTGTVELQGKPVVCIGSLITKCTGNEPGTQKEVVSLNTTGKMFIMQGSPDVKFEGSGAAFTTSQGMGNRL